MVAYSHTGGRLGLGVEIFLVLTSANNLLRGLIGAEEMFVCVHLVFTHLKGKMNESLTDSYYCIDTEMDRWMICVHQNQKQEAAIFTEQDHVQAGNSSACNHISVQWPNYCGFW